MLQSLLFILYADRITESLYAHLVDGNVLAPSGELCDVRNGYEVHGQSPSAKNALRCRLGSNGSVQNCILVANHQAVPGSVDERLGDFSASSWCGHVLMVWVLGYSPYLLECRRWWMLGREQTSFSLSRRVRGLFSSNSEHFDERCTGCSDSNTETLWSNFRELYAA